MPTLTKRDLVVSISNETGLIQSDVFNVIQRTLDHITESLAKGDGVELRNFGVFETRLTRSRIGRNPKNPDVDVPIPPRATVKFKAGKVMRQRVLLRTEELKSLHGGNGNSQG
jgi:nucleoid DNA-binding protein